MYAVAGNVPSQTGDVNIAFFLSKVTSVIYKSSHVGSNWVFEWNLDSYGKQTILNQALWCVYTGLQRTQRTLTRVSESTSGLYMILFPTLQHLYIFCIYFCMVLSRNPWRISVFTLLGQKKFPEKLFKFLSTF